MEIFAREDLVRLYCDEGWSIENIAAEFGWSASFVRNRMLALGIAPRAPWAHQAVDCDSAEIQRMYLEERLSTLAIAAKIGCSEVTIWRRLVAAGVARRPASGQLRYSRADFSGNLAEKAYLIGFRLGDLNVALAGDKTILVKCSSTRSEQVELFTNLFEAYGHVYTDAATLARRQRQSIGMEARLNLTFDFLLPKQDRIPDWILERDDTFFAFFGGYLDAEGYVRTYLPRGYRTPQVLVEIRTYDVVILTTLGRELNRRGISCPPAQVRVLAGYVNRYGVQSNGELWGLGIYKKDSLGQLFEHISPYVRHPRRHRDMLKAWAVVSS